MLTDVQVAILVLRICGCVGALLLHSLRVTSLYLLLLWFKTFAFKVSNIYGLKYAPILSACSAFLAYELMIRPCHCQLIIWVALSWTNAVDITDLKEDIAHYEKFAIRNMEWQPITYTLKTGNVVNTCDFEVPHPKNMWWFVPMNRFGFEQKDEPIYYTRNFDQLKRYIYPLLMNGQMPHLFVYDQETE